LFASEGQRLLRLARHLLYSFGRILFDPSLFNTEIEKCDDSLVLVVAAGGSTGPSVNPLPQVMSPSE
jgi:hypothetical protein